MPTWWRSANGGRQAEADVAFLQDVCTEKDNGPITS